MSNKYGTFLYALFTFRGNSNQKNQIRQQGQLPGAIIFEDSLYFQFLRILANAANLFEEFHVKQV